MVVAEKLYMKKWVRILKALIIIRNFIEIKELNLINSGMKLQIE